MPLLAMITLVPFSENVKKMFWDIRKESKIPRSFNLIW